MKVDSFLMKRNVAEQFRVLEKNSLYMQSGSLSSQLGRNRFKAFKVPEVFCESSKNNDLVII